MMKKKKKKKEKISRQSSRAAVRRVRFGRSEENLSYSAMC
jgi:hypothetical protein